MSERAAASTRLSAADTQFLESIREQIGTVLREVIGEDVDVALIGAPNQKNVGDSLIFAGETRIFRELGLRVRYLSDVRSFDSQTLRKLMPHGVVLLHGGGNFGDIWIGHQLLRERVVSELPDYPVVQLPQSIHFNDPQRADLANQILGVHPRFTLLLRDSLSITKAVDLLPDVEVRWCPDFALGWDPAARDTNRVKGSTLILARADREAASGLAAAGPSWPAGGPITVADWEPRGYRRITWSIARFASRGYRLYAAARRSRFRWLPTGWPDRCGAWIVGYLNRNNIDGAVALFAPHDYVVTDRLHAHVLSGLMGKPHVVLDNNYKKVSTIYNDYTGSFETAHFATDLVEAQEIARKAGRG